MAVQLRRCERFNGKDKWFPCLAKDIKKGDVFRLFDEGETIIETGEPTFALSDAKPTNEGVEGNSVVNCEKVNMYE